MKIAIEVIGWIGATLIVGAYALLSAGKLEGDSRTYHLMNIVGAIGFVVNSGWNGPYSPPSQRRRARHGRLRSPQPAAAAAQERRAVSLAAAAQVPPTSRWAITKA